MGKVSVRLFLNDGYEAPPEEEGLVIDMHSEEYCGMISRSLLQLGNPYRIRKAIEKSKAGKEVTLAYIGGSVTQGAGAIPIHTECYAYKSFQLFQNRFSTQNNVRFIKAGVGGTPSELGMIRFDRDVLREGERPDIVVIEFAVNDEGDETKGVCYESLVRKVLKLPWKPAVVLLFSVFANDWNLQERLRPVGDLYDLPMVSILNAVTPQFSLKCGEGRILSKNQLAGFVDCNFDRKKKMFIVKEINIQKEKAVDKVGLYLTLCSLARFHEADDLIILGEKYHDYH